MYYVASQNAATRENLHSIQVRFKGQPVGWYDLDAGLAAYVTLYDLLRHAEPWVPTEEEVGGDSQMQPFVGRKLFIMTESMWEEGDYPPAVGKRTTSKEGRER